MISLTKIQSIEELLIFAVWKSFHPNETVLSLHQLLLRRLTPTERMSRHIVNRLLQKGLIKVTTPGTESGLFLQIRSGKSYFTAIRPCPYSTRELDLSVVSKVEDDLLDLVFALLSSTLVEYVRHFSSKEKLEVTGLNYDEPSLRPFFEDLSLSQTFMLFWRSVKFSAEEQQSVDFKKIIEDANRFFEQYCAAGKEIKPYPRPTFLVRSQLEKIIFSDLLKIETNPDLLSNVHEYFVHTPSYV